MASHGTGAGIRVDVSGAIRKLEAVGRELEPRTALEVIGLQQLNWINANLRAAGGLERSWAPMSPNTIAARPGRSSGSHFSSGYQGQLQQSMVSEVRGSEVAVGTSLRFALFHHEGTRAYTITPRAGRFLRFMTTSGPVFARSVRHPGLPARPLLPTANKAKEAALEALEAIVERIRAAGGGRGG